MMIGTHTGRSSLTHVRVPKYKHTRITPCFDRLYVLRAVEETIRAESERKHGVETGGVLVGFADPRLKAVVATDASLPGPKAHHGRTTFNRDRAYCRHSLTSAQRQLAVSSTSLASGTTILRLIRRPALSTPQRTEDSRRIQLPLRRVRLC